MKLGLIASCFALVATLATSAAVAMPHTHRAADNATRLDASSVDMSESGTDGEARHMVSYAREVVITVPRVSAPIVCDVVELAQGNGFVRRCGGAL